MSTPAEKIQQEIYLRMTPAQKIEQFYMLRNTAWMLKKAGIRLQHPEWTEDKVEAEVRRVFLYAVS